jgi:putative RecB family exonuclease
VLSKSKITTYEQCGWKYMKQYVEKIPSPPTDAMKRGIDIHKALENVYKDPRIINAKTEKDFKQIIDDISAEIDDGKKGDKWKDHFAAFNVSLLENTGNCIPKIIEGYVKDPQLGLNGIVDRVDSCDTGWVIVDYKTGATKKTLDERNLLELSLYALLTMRKHGGKVAYMGIYYVDSGKLVVEECKQEYIENAIGRMEAARIGIKQGNYPKKPSWMCRFCAYAKTVHCEYG